MPSPTKSRETTETRCSGPKAGDRRFRHRRSPASGYHTTRRGGLSRLLAHDSQRQRIGSLQRYRKAHLIRRAIDDVAFRCLVPGRPSALAKSLSICRRDGHGQNRMRRTLTSAQPRETQSGLRVQ